MKLYSYFRSTAAYRVRIALNVKALDYELLPVHLVKDGGEQFKPDFLALNPEARVPVLIDGDVVLSQSMAILEYLEECYPTPSLLSQDKNQRAQIRSFCQLIAADIHPLNNLSVLNYLKNTLNISDEQKTAWYHHWVARGFQAAEAILTKRKLATPFCFGDDISFADICLVGQVYNALRFECPMTAYPLLESIYQHCITLPVVQKAMPENQVDAV